MQLHTIAYNHNIKNRPVTKTGPLKPNSLRSNRLSSSLSVTPATCVPKRSPWTRKKGHKCPKVASYLVRLPTPPSSNLRDGPISKFQAKKSKRVPRTMKAKKTVSSQHGKQSNKRSHRQNWKRIKPKTSRSYYERKRAIYHCLRGKSTFKKKKFLEKKNRLYKKKWNN